MLQPGSDVFIGIGTVSRDLVAEIDRAELDPNGSLAMRETFVEVVRS